jgi:HSP20 family protein
VIVVARFVDPFEEMDRMFGQFGGRWRTTGGLMPMDAFEKDDVYTLRFDLAGADPDDVDVTVEQGVLTVTAERPVEDTEGANWLVRERPTGTHSRQVRLGDRLDGSSVEARYDRGVLTVTIPIRPEAKPYKVAVASGEHQAVDATVKS